MEEILKQDLRVEIGITFEGNEARKGHVRM